MRGRVDAGQRHRFRGGRRRQIAEATFHPDPAGGAASPPTAHGGMGHVLHAADLEQRGTRRYPNSWPTAIGHRHPGAGGAADDPYNRHEEGKAEQCEECVLQPVAQSDQSGTHGGIRRARGGLQPLQLARFGNLRRHLPTGHREARQRRHRQGDGQGEQDLPRLRVPGRQAEPVVDADAAVHPYAQQQRGMLEGEHRPDVGEFEGVGVIGAGEAGCAAVEDHVREEEERNGKSADDLSDLPERQLPGEPERNLVKGQRDMGHKGAEQDDRTRPGPCHDLAPVLHGMHRL